MDHVLVVTYHVSIYVFLSKIFTYFLFKMITFQFTLMKLKIVDSYIIETVQIPQ